jgi:DNA-binding XRE family transcriptional regulator
MCLFCPKSDEGGLPVADIYSFPNGKSERSNGTEQAWMEHAENFRASLAGAIHMRDVRPYIEQCKPVWETEGNILKQLRIARGLLVAHVAEGIGVSPERIKRLEAGEPVRDSVLLKKAYMLFITHQHTRPGTGVMQ